MNNINIISQLKNYIGYAHAKFTRISLSPNPPRSSNYKHDISFLSTREQDNLYGLYLFMKCYPQVSNDTLKKIIYDETNQFRILRALCKEFHVLIEYLRADGYDNVCSSIVKTRSLQKKPNTI